ncbi:MAG: hypothetical protein U0235_27465 [Polyangiaceae bacterium]
MKPQRPDIDFPVDAEVTAIDPKPWFLAAAEAEAAAKRTSTKSPPSRRRPSKS